ncbi:MAG: hypothetical protein KC912_18295 [Proteobacteria bacterium]|nr:hypothetical protein [Pseudomonadota bacterium]
MDKWVLGLLPVALGLTALALPGAARWLRPARWIALTLAVALAGLELLPDAYGELGWLAVLPFGVGLLGPSVVERLSGLGDEHHHGSAHHLHHDHDHGMGHGSLMLGFVGLGFHQIFDGLQIAFVHDTLGPQATVVIGFHGAPLVAAFVLTCRNVSGRVIALRAGLALVALTAVGIALGGLAPEGLVEPIEPWLAGFVAGVLLHVVYHDA